MTESGSTYDETIERARTRARRYWYEDGAVDLAVAAVFLLIALLFTFEAWQPEGSALRGLSAIGLPLVTIGGYFLARRVVGAIKARVTYPRTGRVDYVQARPQERRRSVIVACLTAFVVAIAVSMADVDSWIPTLQGLTIGLFLLYLARTVQVERYARVAAGSVVLGLLASRLGIGAVAGTAVYFGGLTLLLLVSGLLALRAFVAAAPPPEEEAPEEVPA